MVTDDLDVVAIVIEDEGAVVGGVILRSETWSSVILASSSQRSFVERVNLRVRVSREGDVDRRLGHSSLRDPEIRLATGAKAATARLLFSFFAWELHDRGVTERSQSCEEELLRALVVADSK